MRSLLILCFIHFVWAISPKDVPYKILRDGNKMPGIALGTWLGTSAKPGANSSVPEHQVEDAVSWAIDAGYRHIDTAFIYMIEDQVGRAIDKKIKDGSVKREDLFVTSKLWNDQHSKDKVVPALRATLQRLGLEYLDLYLIHWPFAVDINGAFEPTDYLETWLGMIEARRLNLTRSIGVSNFNVTQLERLAHEGHKEIPAVLEVEVNLNLQQTVLLDYAKDHNITVMGYTPFGSLFGDRGFANSKTSSLRANDPKLVLMANKYNKTVPQLVLRYLVELGVVPIPKSVTKERIEQNIDIFDFKLSWEDILELRTFNENLRTIAIERFKNHMHYPFAA